MSCPQSYEAHKMEHPQKKKKTATHGIRIQALIWN
jgi:hypothetical protein